MQPITKHDGCRCYKTTPWLAMPSTWPTWIIFRQLSQCHSRPRPTTTTRDFVLSVETKSLVNLHWCFLCSLFILSWDLCDQSYFRNKNENEELLHFVLWVRKRELWQFVKRKRYENKNYSGKNERKREQLQTKKRKQNIWANHTAILCQPDVTQHCKLKLASSSSTNNSGITWSVFFLCAAFCVVANACSSHLKCARVWNWIRKCCVLLGLFCEQCVCVWQQHSNKSVVYCVENNGWFLVLNLYVCSN